MRIFALITNTSALCFFAYLFVTEWPHRKDEWVIIPLVVAFLIVNLVAISINKPRNPSSSWIFLYFERKRLEEKKKIQQLKASTNDH